MNPKLQIESYQRKAVFKSAAVCLFFLFLLTEIALQFNFDSLVFRKNNESLPHPKFMLIVAKPVFLSKRFNLYQLSWESL